MMFYMFQNFNALFSLGEKKGLMVSLSLTMVTHYEFFKNNVVCVETNFNCPLSIIKEVLVRNHENVFMTYEFWYKAFSHFALSFIEKIEKLLKKQYHTRKP